MRISRLFVTRVVGVCLLAASVAAPISAQQPPATAPQPETIVKQVRAAITKDDFAAANERLAADRARNGLTPEWLEAHSWMARGYLAAKRLDDAERSANDTYKMASAMLKTRPMDQEPHLPIAYGAAVEVLAQVGVERGARSESIVMLEREIKKNRGTSIVKRLQKNVNLVTLEGKKAPRLTVADYIGSRPPSLDALKGQVLLLFFWAHWCPDCKRMAPILAELDKQDHDRGLTIVAPTQRYGYVAGGKNASPAEEKPYIDQIRKEFYPVLAGAPMPLDEANHLRYGVSTTPTIVLVDRAGIIRLYHPGQMTLDELRPRLDDLLRTPVRTSSH